MLRVVIIFGLRLGFYLFLLRSRVILLLCLAQGRPAIRANGAAARNVKL